MGPLQYSSPCFLPVLSCLLKTLRKPLLMLTMCALSLCVTESAVRAMFRGCCDSFSDKFRENVLVPLAKSREKSRLFKELDDLVYLALRVKTGGPKKRMKKRMVKFL